MHDCPACGFDQLDFEPWVGDSASDEICKCCGIQFGYDDARRHQAPSIYERWRAQWIADGCLWWSRSRPAPADWSPEAQVRKFDRT